MRQWKFAVALLALTALLVASAVFAGDRMDAGKTQVTSTMKKDMKGEMAAQVAIDKPAPDFTLTGVDGKEYSLSEFKGKDVVLEWINFDCPFVHKHYYSGNMPDLQEKYIGKDGVIWLSICSSAPGKQGYYTGDKLSKRMKDAHWNATAYLVDADGAVGRMYGAKTTPHMFIIDKDGILRYDGAIDDTPSTRVEDLKTAKNYVSAALDEIMADKAVATKTSTPYGCSVKYGEMTKPKSDKTM